MDMVYIFHGDDQNKSRTAYNKFLDTHPKADIFRLDAKDTTPDNINNFVNGQSLFNSDKILAVSNFFSIPKANLDKIIKIIKSNTAFDVCLWQDKKLTVAQTSTFPGAKIEVFTLSNQLFGCINAIRPGNLNQFVSLYHSTIQKEPFDLLFYLIKNSLRKQLSSYSKFSIPLLKSTYLQLIELDYQNKTGQLTTDREIALERIISSLLIHSK